jgi:hypothetical protein
MSENARLNEICQGQIWGAWRGGNLLFRGSPHISAVPEIKGSKEKRRKK